MPRETLIKGMFAINVLMFALLASLLLGGAARRQAPELTVERINIVDADGRLALVLSNGARLPGAMFNGKEYPQSFVGRGKSAGMIFYNAAGDEVGGLIFEGTKSDSSHNAFGHFSFDQWQQSQVVAMQYVDRGGMHSAGLQVWDRPDSVPLERQFTLAQQLMNMPAGAVRDSVNRERLRVKDQVAGTPRMFVGSENRVAKVELRDEHGRVRLRLLVDSTGTGRLLFLDSDGRVTSSYPR